MNKTIPAETGCYIDGSHRSEFDFMALVIELAHDYGFELDWKLFVSDVDKYRSGDFSDEDGEDGLFILTDTYWTYDDAIEYLNDNTRDGLVWVVEDQSLFLMTEEDACK